MQGKSAIHRHGVAKIQIKSEPGLLPNKYFRKSDLPYSLFLLRPFAPFNSYIVGCARANFIEPQYTDDHTEVFRFIKYDNATTLNYAQLPITRNGDKVTCTEKDKDGNVTTYELTPVDAKLEIYFRNGGTLTRHYPGPHNQFEDIKATYYRVTYYIPQDAINSYPGTLTQNPTSDAGLVLH